MKTWKLALCAALWLAAAPAASIAENTGSSIHTSGGGAPCIRDGGSTYDASTNWYTYHWSNTCEVSITLRVFRFDSNDKSFTVNIDIPARGSNSMIIQRFSSVDWEEVF